MIFGVEERLVDIEENGLGARDVGNLLELSFVRRVGGRGTFKFEGSGLRGDDARGEVTRGDDTGGEEVVYARREKRSSGL